MFSRFNFIAFKRITIKSDKDWGSYNVKLEYVMSPTTTML